ncbi:RNA-directed DNA polymerase from mobile element jockey [Trichonephila clavipes]|nr:RNA-directed DNA polymerase from mobile element jockey [Trichonephila clavipes]
MAYSDFEKAEVFKDTLEVTFQENEEPYCDDKIEEVESLVDDYFDNFATCTPLSLPLRDVKRAFDKLWHDGLTYKLIKLQFPDYLIKIIHNFLHNRTFRVRVNNSYSNTGSCLSGVPQGSVLSPYLYNIYTHDFPQHSTVSTCLFADDSAVLSQGVQLKYTIKNIQHFLDKLETWLTHWRIAINVDKTQAIVFRKWGVIDPPFQLTLFDDYIQWVPVVKYLGLHIDSRLTFKSTSTIYLRNSGVEFLWPSPLSGGGLLYP